MKRRRRKGNRRRRRSDGSGDEGQRGAENQYEITLARVSAKLQVIKRADKQMKQREARGAASPRREQEEKEEDHRTERPSGRELKKKRGTTRELISRVKQILFGQRAADGERANDGRKRDE